MSVFNLVVQQLIPSSLTTLPTIVYINLGSILKQWPGAIKGSQAQTMFLLGLVVGLAAANPLRPPRMEGITQANQ